VWLAGREWRLAQESACDAAALAATGASRTQYGDLLLGMIAAQHARRPRLRRGLGIGAVSLAAVLSVIPLRLVAKEPAAPEGTGRREVAPNSNIVDAGAPASLGEGGSDAEALTLAWGTSYLNSPQAALAAAAEGIVTRVAVEEGQRVKSGELLVELEADEPVRCVRRHFYCAARADTSPARSAPPARRWRARKSVVRRQP
jgi:hypothetical protein